MTTLILILMALILAGGTYAMLEAILGQTIAAVLNPVGWAVILACETITGRDDDEE